MRCGKERGVAVVRGEANYECRESLSPNAKSGSGTREGKVGGGDCAPIAEELGAYDLQKCRNGLCCEGVGAVAGYDLVALQKSAPTVTEGKAEKFIVLDEI